MQYKGVRTGNRRTVTAFAYIMHEGRQIAVPSLFYLNTCLEGYDTFYFDKQKHLQCLSQVKRSCIENDPITLFSYGPAPVVAWVYSGHGAVSRADNLTVICPDCGTREALESIGVDEKEQEKILKTIHKICI